MNHLYYRICLRCTARKHLSDYEIDDASDDGLNVWCRPCGGVERLRPLRPPNRRIAPAAVASTMTDEDKLSRLRKLIEIGTFNRLEFERELAWWLGCSNSGRTHDGLD